MSRPIRFSNLQYIPTWKIECILAEPYNRGLDGKDYGPVKHELEEILWRRKARMAENEQKRIEREKAAEAAAMAEKSSYRVSLEQAPKALDEGIPPYKAVEIWILENGFSTVAIPPVILPF
jgi:hypothetical protein